MNIIELVEQLTKAKNDMIITALDGLGYVEDFIEKNVNDFSAWLVSDEDPMKNVEKYFYNNKLLFSVITEYNINKNETTTKIEFPKEDKNMDVQNINDGGERMCYEKTGALREPSTGKGRYDLISPFALDRLAKWYELGAQKYADRNWEKGIPYSRFIDSSMRHLNKYMMGMTDEDHLSAAVWNLLCIIHFEQLGRGDLDDLPHYLKKCNDTNERR